MKYNYAVVHFFVSVRQARRLLFRAAISGSKETQKRGFIVRGGAVLSWCMLLQQQRAMAGLCPSMAVCSQQALSYQAVGSSHLYEVAEDNIDKAL